MAVELRREESRRGLEDLIGPAELPVLPLELLQPAPLLRGEAGPCPSSISALRTHLRSVSELMPMGFASSRICCRDGPLPKTDGVIRSVGVENRCDVEIEISALSNRTIASVQCMRATARRGHGLCPERAPSTREVFGLDGIDGCRRTQGRTSVTQPCFHVIAQAARGACTPIILLSSPSSPKAGGSLGLGACQCFPSTHL